MYFGTPRAPVKLAHVKERRELWDMWILLLLLGSPMLGIVGAIEAVVVGILIEAINRTSTNERVS